MSAVLTIIKSFGADVVFLVVCAALLFVFTLYFGKGRMVSIILAYYPSKLIFDSLPFLQKLIVLHGDKLIVLNKIIVFVIIIAIISIIIERFILIDSFSGGATSILKTIGLAIAGLILILVFSYGTVSFDVLFNFSAQIDALFSPNTYLFYWNLVPIILLAVI